MIDLETNLPLGFPSNGYPGPQGPYYTSVGARNTKGRELVDEHLHLCLEAGLNVEGINAEVMMGQWEYQIFAKGAKSAGDQIWLARYLLELQQNLMTLPSTCIPNPSRVTGMVPACMQTSQMVPCDDEGGEALFKKNL